MIESAGSNCSLGAEGSPRRRALAESSRRVAATAPVSPGARWPGSPGCSGCPGLGGWGAGCWARSGGARQSSRSATVPAAPALSRRRCTSQTPATPSSKSSSSGIVSMNIEMTSVPGERIAPATKLPTIA